jgi:hypothetical protein
MACDDEDGDDEGGGGGGAAAALSRRRGAAAVGPSTLSTLGVNRTHSCGGSKQLPQVHRALLHAVRQFRVM